MWRYVIFLGSLFFVQFANAQHVAQDTVLDMSPMDMSYLPRNYPELKSHGEVRTPPLARVIYSRPKKNGRNIFGNVVVYGRQWRMGANESTEIEFFKPVKINNKTINKGRYTISAICYEDKWTIILNKDVDTWGLYYNPKNDVIRVDVPVQHLDYSVESLAIYFDLEKTAATLNVTWDNIKVALPIRLQ